MSVCVLNTNTYLNPKNYRTKRGRETKYVYKITTTTNTRDSSKMFIRNGRQGKDVWRDNVETFRMREKNNNTNT